MFLLRFLHSYGGTSKIISMYYILIFVIVVLVVLLVRKSREKVVGICEAVMESWEKKRENLEKVFAGSFAHYL